MNHKTVHTHGYYLYTVKLTYLRLTYSNPCFF